MSTWLQRRSSLPADPLPHSHQALGFRSCEGHFIGLENLRCQLCLLEPQQGEHIEVQGVVSFLCETSADLLFFAHTPWAHKDIPVPTGKLDKVINIFKVKIVAGLCEPSNAS